MSLGEDSSMDEGRLTTTPTVTGRHKAIGWFLIDKQSGERANVYAPNIGQRRSIGRLPLSDIALDLPNVSSKCKLGQNTSEHK